MTEIQEAAKKVLDGWTPETFCQKVLAEDADGMATSPTSKQAVKFCYYGKVDNSEISSAMDGALRARIGQILKDDGLAQVNDRPDGYSRLSSALRKIIKEG